MILSNADLSGLAVWCVLPLGKTFKDRFQSLPPESLAALKTEKNFDEIVRTVGYRPIDIIKYFDDQRFCNEVLVAMFRIEYNVPLFGISEDAIKEAEWLRPWALQQR